MYRLISSNKYLQCVQCLNVWEWWYQVEIIFTAKLKSDQILGMLGITQFSVFWLLLRNVNVTCGAQDSAQTIFSLTHVI
jgi:hypothetical protein